MGFWQRLDATLQTKAGAAYDPSARFINSRGQAARQSEFGDGRTAITEGFERCTWVYRCVRRKMDMCASVPWLVRSYDETGAFTDDRLHPAAFIVNNPTVRAWDRVYQMSRATGFLSVTGNAPFGKYGPSADDESPERWRSAPGAELRLESPVGVQPIEDGAGWILRYDVDGGQSASWDPATIVHVMLPSLTTQFWGMSELQALAMTIDTAVEGRRWNLDSFGSGGMPSAILVDYTVQEADLEIARGKMEEVLLRKGRQRTPLIIPGASIASGSEPFKAAIELHKLGMTAQEMDWLEGSKMARDEIYVGMGFHPAEASNAASKHDNVRTADRQAWTRAAMPLLQAFSSWFTLRLLTYEERLSGMVLMPDLSEVEELKAARESVAETFFKLTRGGLTVRDAAKVAGVEISDLDEYDRPRPVEGRIAEEREDDEREDA